VSVLKWLAAMVLTATALTSCVDIEMRFVMQRDGGGQLYLTCRVPYEATTLLDVADGQPAIPLPIARADFEAALAGADGVRLRRFRRTDGDGEVRITAQIAFDSVASLRTITGFADLPASFAPGGDGGGELSQRVIPARAAGNAPDQAMIDLLQSIGGGHRVVFVVVAPADIEAADGATIDPDGRTARFSRSLADYLTANGPVDLVVRW